MLAVEGIGALILWGHWLLSGTVPAADAGFYGLFHEGVAVCHTVREAVRCGADTSARDPTEPADGGDGPHG